MPNLFPIADTSPPGTSLQDEEIYCPICTYNLSGNLTGRCSECGSLFDRRLLTEAQRVSAENLIPWDSPTPMSPWTRWCRTVCICCVQPRRFAFAFGVQPRRTRAMRFCLSVLLVATFAVVVAAIIPQVAPVSGQRQSAFRQLREQSGYLYLSFGVAILWGGTWGATISTACAFWAFFPHADGRRRFGPWFSLIQYAACHCLFMVLLPLLVIAFAIAGMPDRGAWFPAVYLGIGLMCVLLWAATLRDVVAERSPTRGYQAAAVLISLLCGLGWPILTFVGLMVLM